MSISYSHLILSTDIEMEWEILSETFVDHDKDD